ncbi:hypothetical protein C2G38_2048927 [Gigaspora rosea]|uniref:Regulator of chromosome segregation-like C-terminal domain-containing protein n=1 Tax=Gigaspora rosea TaxID=44941 RepID=A0A397U0S2_9GLOM|nr:hypothetical protein C2G38_2048927 [Gigaspora rosea]
MSSPLSYSSTLCSLDSSETNFSSPSVVGIELFDTPSPLPRLAQDNSCDICAGMFNELVESRKKYEEACKSLKKELVLRAKTYERQTSDLKKQLDVKDEQLAAKDEQINKQQQYNLENLNIKHKEHMNMQVQLDAQQNLNAQLQSNLQQLQSYLQHMQSINSQLQSNLNQQQEVNFQQKQQLGTLQEQLNLCQAELERQRSLNNSHLITGIRRCGFNNRRDEHREGERKDGYKEVIINAMLGNN